MFVIELLGAQRALLHEGFERTMRNARPSLSAHAERGEFAGADELFEDGAAAADSFGRFGDCEDKWWCHGVVCPRLSDNTGQKATRIFQV